MDSILIFSILRIIAAGLMAYLLLRLTQRPLRWFIVQMIPLKIRMKPNGFVLQMRIVNAAGISILLLLTALFYFQKPRNID